MLPLSESKMNVAGADADGTMNPPVSLNTSPVGAPPSTGTVSSGPLIGLPCTAPAYTGLESLWLCATQSGLVGPAARPHAFCRLESVISATPGWSLTRFVTEYLLFG